MRSASQNSRLSRERTQAGWLLISSIMTLGSAVVKGLLKVANLSSKFILIFKRIFRSSSKNDAVVEKW